MKVVHGSLTLIVFAGTPGTGKTTLARRLLSEATYTFIESDECWRKLFSVPQYTAAESEVVFNYLTKSVEKAFQSGQNVLVDGVFASRSRIERLENLVRKYSACIYIMVLHCSWEVALERMKCRFIYNGRTITPKEHWLSLATKIQDWLSDKKPTIIDTTTCPLDNTMDIIRSHLRQHPLGLD